MDIYAYVLFEYICIHYLNIYAYIMYYLNIYAYVLFEYICIYYIIRMDIEYICICIRIYMHMYYLNIYAYIISCVWIYTHIHPAWNS